MTRRQTLIFTRGGQHSPNMPGICTPSRLFNLFASSSSPTASISPLPKFEAPCTRPQALDALFGVIAASSIASRSRSGHVFASTKTSMSAPLPTAAATTPTAFVSCRSSDCQLKDQVGTCYRWHLERQPTLMSGVLHDTAAPEVGAEVAATVLQVKDCRRTARAWLSICSAQSHCPKSRSPTALE